MDQLTMDQLTFANPRIQKRYNFFVSYTQMLHITI